MATTTHQNQKIKPTSPDMNSVVCGECKGDHEVTKEIGNSMPSMTQIMISAIENLQERPASPTRVESLAGKKRRSSTGVNFSQSEHKLVLE